jgi:hypothetical protein
MHLTAFLHFRGLGGSGTALRDVVFIHSSAASDCDAELCCGWWNNREKNVVASLNRPFRENVKRQLSALGEKMSSRQLVT